MTITAGYNLIWTGYRKICTSSAALYSTLGLSFKLCFGLCVSLVTIVVKWERDTIKLLISKSLYNSKV